VWVARCAHSQHLTKYPPRASTPNSNSVATAPQPPPPHLPHWKHHVEELWSAGVPVVVLWGVVDWRWGKTPILGHASKWHERACALRQWRCVALGGASVFVWYRVNILWCSNATGPTQSSFRSLNHAAMEEGYLGCSAPPVQASRCSRISVLDRQGGPGAR